MKENVIEIVFLVFVLIWCIVTTHISCSAPIEPYQLPLEERMKYERMIF